jgi:plastocyanin
MHRRVFLILAGAGLARVGLTGAARADDATEIKIDNFVFNPATVTVKRGATVRWVNHDDIPHSVLFPALKLRSKVMDTDEAFTHAFEQAGSFDYVCGLHPHMKGKLIVTA